MKKTQRKSGNVFLPTIIGAIILLGAVAVVAVGGLLDLIPAGDGYGVRNTIDLWLSMFNGGSSKALFATAIICCFDAMLFSVTALYACAKGKPIYVLPALGAACAIAFLPFDVMLSMGLIANKVMTRAALCTLAGSYVLLGLGWILMMMAMRDLFAMFLFASFDMVPAPHDEEEEEEEVPEEEEGEFVVAPEHVSDEPVVVEDEEEEPQEEAKEEEAEEEKAPEEELVVEELAPEEEVPVAEEAPEEVVEEEAPVEEPAPVETPVEEPVAAEAEAEEAEGGLNLNAIQRKSFSEKLELMLYDLRNKYEELKNEALSYGLKNRISNSGDTYHLGRKNYLKIMVIGKTLRVYYALDPKDYAESPIPVEDVSAKKAYADMPVLFRVKSDLSLRRAKKLLADMMKRDGIEQKAVEEAPAPVAAEAVEAAPAEEVKILGKYEVFPEEDEYKYRLKANNGEILIVSNGYSSRPGAKNGIETLKRNVEGGVTRIVTDKNGYSQFRIFNANESRLIVSGEFYKSKDRAESASNSVKRFYATDKIVDLDEIPADERREWIIDAVKEEDRETPRR